MDACIQARRLEYLVETKWKNCGVICHYRGDTSAKIILFTNYSHALCDPRMSAFSRKNMIIVFELFTLVCRQPLFLDHLHLDRPVSPSIKCTVSFERKAGIKPIFPMIQLLPPTLPPSPPPPHQLFSFLLVRPIYLTLYFCDGGIIMHLVPV